MVNSSKSFNCNKRENKRSKWQGFTRVGLFKKLQEVRLAGVRPRLRSGILMVRNPIVEWLLISDLLKIWIICMSTQVVSAFDQILEIVSICSWRVVHNENWFTNQIKALCLWKWYLHKQRRKFWKGKLNNMKGRSTVATISLTVFAHVLNVQTWKKQLQRKTETKDENIFWCSMLIKRGYIELEIKMRLAFGKTKM